MKKICVLLVLALILSVACAESDYPDGIYRGFYYDGGIEQLAIQFELQDGLFSSFVYRAVRYIDGDYMSRNASDAQKATLYQYNELAQHLIGKGIEAIEDLYTPYDFVADVDSVTSATIQSSKLISAIWDGLNRHPYKLIDTTKLGTADPYQDGVYRGQYMEDNTQQVALEFTLKDNTVSQIRFTALQFGGVDYLATENAVTAQFMQLIYYLEGRDVSAVNDLYRPETIASDIDAVSAATLSSPKVISAVWDALGRHAYTIDH